jgi:uroporphyrinogen III methyltransferase/synthase
MSTGKVYLVGAGPGDFKLISVKGLECIKKADVVIYDRLANRRLLLFAPPQAELLYVGKEAGVRVMEQKQIGQLIVAKAREGKTIVRLKGGDPFIFGRGGEEAEVLADKGIDFEVVPGVSSAHGVPAYAGIPITHRGLSSTVAIVTGHEDPTKKQSQINWENLATAVDTIVFLMGMKNLPFIVEQLIKYGRAKDTPAAIIYRGTTAEQKTVVGSLENIVELSQKEGLKPPSVVVIGEVVRLRDKLEWAEKRPLFGKRILITRAREQAGEMVETIEELGGEAIELPTIKIVAPQSYEVLDRAIHRISEPGAWSLEPGAVSGVPGASSLACPERSRREPEASAYDWIIFTSANGVEFFFQRLRELRKDVRILKGIKLAAIGPATAGKLEKAGLLIDFMPGEYVAEAVIEGLKNLGISGKRVLIPRAEVAREILPQELERLGAKVDAVPTYRTVSDPSAIEELRKLLSEARINIIAFTSSSTVKNFMKATQGLDLANLLKDVQIACIGPVTAETAEECGLVVSVTAKDYTIQGLVQSMVEMVKG